jgi:radical SAM superfamily enzyme YgiQ (UPF0313 family)
MLKNKKTKHLDCLLISPPESFSPYPYLGLCSLAGSLIENGIHTQIIDSSALQLSLKELLLKIINLKPQIIGISVMSTMLRQCYRIIQAIKIHSPDATIVVGGAHINADPSILPHLGVPYGFRGDCEDVFPRFCKLILDRKDPASINGLIVNDHGNIRANEIAFISDLNKLAAPAYNLLPLTKYRIPHSNTQLISISASRGCPFNCIFCSKLERKPHRSLKIDKIIAQLELLINEYNIKWIEFADEIFTLKRQWVIDLCKNILKKRFHFYWGAETRADMIDEELLKLMSMAGCRKLGFGVETGSERIRFLENKKIDNALYIRAIHLCKKYKIKTIASYILGHPTETKEELYQTLNFASKLQTDIAYFNKMILIPNSEIFQMAKESDPTLSGAWSAFMLGKKGLPLFYPDSVSKKIVDKVYNIARKRFRVSPWV